MALNSNKMNETIEKHLRESAATKIEAISTCSGSILEAAEMIAACVRRGSKLLLCGNGGSAADCQHLAAEFVSVLSQEFIRPGIAAIALTTDSSFLTAYSNDFGYEGVFERQVETLGRSGDVLIGISTSGSSKNVLRAVRSARTLDIGTIALMGQGGALAEEADVAICVPHTSTMIIQETHLAIEHILCELVEREIH